MSTSLPASLYFSLCKHIPSFPAGSNTDGCLIATEPLRGLSTLERNCGVNTLSCWKGKHNSASRIVCHPFYYFRKCCLILKSGMLWGLSCCLSPTLSVPPANAKTHPVSAVEHLLAQLKQNIYSRLQT
uniref:Uncharacterized protein n=1 Tax=Malurus cyaneus samueli TaxID=2593467 RepID=A0A8C5X660_9PASS